MAAKKIVSDKKGMTLAEKLAAIDSISAKINDKYGKTIIGRVSSPEIAANMTIRFIPTNCPQLNIAIGGGYPRGRCTVIAGSSDSGKTSRILEDIGYHMKQNPEFVAVWIESENSVEKEYACNTFGIDPERFTFIKYDPDLGAEGILDTLYGLMNVVPFDLICINSLRCLTPTKMIENSVGDATPAIQARMNSRMVSKFIGIVSDSDTAFVVITHTFSNIGTYGAPQIITGGNALKYWSALTMQFNKLSIQEADPISKQEGIKVGVSVTKNHCVVAKCPYVKIEYFAIFGEGTEQILSLLPKLIDAGIITKSGAFFSVNGIEKKFQGKAQFRQYMKDNPEEFERLKGRLGANLYETETMDEDEIEDAQAEEARDAAAAGESK